MPTSKWPRIKWNQACAELANKPFEHLFETPLAECDTCHRKTWDAEELGNVCGMTQPDGFKCGGVFKIVPMRAGV